jgi:hypothetical protein
MAIYHHKHHGRRSYDGSECRRVPGLEQMARCLTLPSARRQQAFQLLTTLEHVHCVRLELVLDNLIKRTTGPISKGVLAQGYEAHITPSTAGGQLIEMLGH